MGYQMTEQSTNEWNINNMPWRSNITDDSVINFVGTTTNPSNFPSTSNMSQSSFAKTKRKYSPDPDIEL
jgi:hypothetical protein